MTTIEEECDCSRCQLERKMSPLMEAIQSENHTDVQQTSEDLYPVLAQFLTDVSMKTITDLLDQIKGLYQLSFGFAILGRPEEEVLQVISSAINAMTVASIKLLEVKDMHRTVKTIEMMHEVDDGNN